MNYHELVEEALKAKEKAYAPYSHFRVGAALQTADGKIYTGCNVENASFGLAICAERVAIFKAISDGCQDFKAIAVVGDSDNFCSPCGSCRQVMAEFAPEMPVIMVGANKDYQVQKVRELIPGYFSVQDIMQVVPQKKN